MFGYIRIRCKGFRFSKHVSKYFVSLTLETQEDLRELKKIYEKIITVFNMSAKSFLVNDIVKMDNPGFSCLEQEKTKKKNKELT